VNTLKIKDLLLTVCFALILMIIWCWNQTLENQEEQSTFLSVSICLFSVCILFKKLSGGFYLKYALWLDLITVSVAFTAIFSGWNIFFTQYAAASDFKGNIFRGAFAHFRAPMYGHLFEGKINPESGMYLSVFLFLILFFYWFHKNSFNFSILQWLLLFALLLIGFSWNDSFYNTFLSNHCHYETLANDKDAFSSVKDLLLNFSNESSALGVHNNHYPPGNLLLLKLESVNWPFVLKPLVFIGTLLSLIPLYKLMETLNFHKMQIFYSLLLYISSGSILLFPKIDPSALVLPFAVLGVYYIVKYISTNKVLYAFLFGLMISLYLFFSFMSLFYGFFCFILLFVLFINKKISIKQAIAFASVSVGLILCIYFMIFLISGFDLYACFHTSFENEKKQMAYSGIGDLTRYFIISSGDLIAYLCVLGVPAIGALILGLKEIKLITGSLFNIIAVSLIITILSITFSNQFFLETERIWIIFTPFVFIVAGYFLERINVLNAVSNVYLIALVAVITTLYLGLKIDFCY
jgi:hypothetical protein